MRNYHIFDYDSRGNLHIDKLYGEDKQLTLGWDGVAIKRYTYDANGKRRGEEYFGKDGKGKEDIFGVHKVLYQYNNTCLKFFFVQEHCLEKIEYFNRNKERTRVKSISSPIPRQYRLTRWEEFKRNAASIAAYRFSYDQKGRVISRETLDEKDRPLALRKARGIAKTVFGYDEFGNPRLYETYGVDHKLRNNIKGIARYHFLYAKGKKVYEENYNQNGNLVGKFYYRNGKKNNYERFTAGGNLKQAEYSITLGYGLPRKIVLHMNQFHIPERVEFIK